MDYKKVIKTAFEGCRRTSVVLIEVLVNDFLLTKAMLIDEYRSDAYFSDAIAMNVV